MSNQMQIKSTLVYLMGKKANQLMQQTGASPDNMHAPDVAIIFSPYIRPTIAKFELSSV